MGSSLRTYRITLPLSFTVFNSKRSKPDRLRQRFITQGMTKRWRDSDKLTALKPRTGVLQEALTSLNVLASSPFLLVLLSWNINPPSARWRGWRRGAPDAGIHFVGPRIRWASPPRRPSAAKRYMSTLNKFHIPGPLHSTSLLPFREFNWKSFSQRWYRSSNLSLSALYKFRLRWPSHTINLFFVYLKLKSIHSSDIRATTFLRLNCILSIFRGLHTKTRPSLLKSRCLRHQSLSSDQRKPRRQTSVSGCIVDENGFREKLLFGLNALFHSRADRTQCRRKLGWRHTDWDSERQPELWLMQITLQLRKLRRKSVFILYACVFFPFLFVFVCVFLVSFLYACADWNGDGINLPRITPYVSKMRWQKLYLRNNLHVWSASGLLNFRLLLIIKSMEPVT